MIFFRFAETFGNNDVQVIQSSNVFKAISFSDSSLYAGDTVSQLRLERYYKSDWHGLVTSVDKQSGVPDLTRWTMAMTCRHVTDRIDQVMRILSQLQD